MTRLTRKLVLSLGKITNEIKKQRMPLFIILMFFSLSGCQLLDDRLWDDNLSSYSENANIDFGHYYLWIKSLDADEIAEEIILQKSNAESGYEQANVQLIMLFSLPSSPVHNPYTAKTMLNDYSLGTHAETIFNSTDLAFIVMLKDQLNQQLLLLEQLINFKGVYQQAKDVSKVQESQVNQLNKKINQLNKQIIQLKTIEKTISKRGQ